MAPEATVCLVTLSDKPQLDALMQAYLAEMHPVFGDEPGPDGCYPYPYLDLYWTEQGRYPYFILAGDRLAGFALVRGLEAGPDPQHEMAEFYVLPDQRGQGIGQSAAHRLFDHYPGRWRVAQVQANGGAQRFWRRVISTYSGDRYEETLDAGTGDSVQLFRSPTSGPGRET